MWRSTAITATVVFLLASSGAVPPASSAAAHRTHRSRCLPHGANTIAVDRSVRVYYLPEYVEGVRMQRGTYACLLRRGTTLPLEPPEREGPLPELSRITLAGIFVAFVDYQHGVDAGCDIIEVIDVPTGRTALVAGVGCSVDACQIRCERATDLVVNEHGTVAWIVTRSGFGHPSPSIEVHSASTSGSTALLDSGLGIVPGSLRLAPGGEVSWLDAGRAEYAYFE
jgi:hypothetical protein